LVRQDKELLSGTTMAEQVTSYRYLGFIFNQNGLFNEAMEALSRSALKVVNMIIAMSKEWGGFSCDTLCLAIL